MRAAVQFVAAVVATVGLGSGAAKEAGMAQIASVPPKLPPHPRLLVSAAELPAIRARADRVEWARAFRDGLKRRCDDALPKPVALPPRGGQWWHYYSCPEHGARLRTESPTRHVCPVDGEVFTGWPYDDVVLSADHDRWATTTRDLGLMYALTGDRTYASKAREILLAYADRYLSYPLHNTKGEAKVGGGRVLPQTLDESIWLIAMAQGADLIWDALSPADIAALKTKLFYPAATEVIMPHRMGIHNIQCWKNAAVGLVGLLFDDPALVADAIDSEDGFRAQMAKGVSPDGPWYEGAWGYHFYTMSALVPLAEAAHRCGIDLYGDPLRRMFSAPIDLAMPNGQLPAFNDSGATSADGNSLYEIALARYRDPRFAEPLRQSDRRSLEAFIAGADTLPDAPTEAPASHNFEKVGYAVLRAGSGRDAAFLCLKYGPHGGGHGHPDKLSFVAYGGRRVAADDPGTCAYGIPAHAGWYRTTVAHNTLVVDERSQEPATGSCLSLKAGAGWSGVLADAGEAIANVRFRRAAVLLGTDVAVFVDLAFCEDKVQRTFDFVLHPSGRWEALPAGAEAAPSQKPGYSYLRDMRTIDGAGGMEQIVADAKTGAPTCWVVFAADRASPPTYMLGSGVGATTEDRVPVVIARRKATAVVQAWALTLRGDVPKPRVELVSVGGAGARAAAVRVRAGGRAWLVIANPEGAELNVGGWSGRDLLAAMH